MIAFREVQPEDSAMILAWRTKPRVASQMATEVAADISKQDAWLMQCYERSDYYHWVIESNGEPVGLVNLTGLDLRSGSTSWGFYVGEDSALGVGAFVPPYFYNFCFTVLRLNRVLAEVLSSNESVLRMHMFHGYKRCPDGDREVLRNGTPQTMLSLSLESSDWLRGRLTKMRSEFPVALWKAAPAILLN